jgi:single-strand DNA-binding protein
MKAIKNKVQLIGHVGAAPEIKIFDAEKKLANFSLAVNDSYKNAKGDWVDETQWFNLVAWSGLANYAELHLFKGAEVAVEGRLVNKSYVDKNEIKRWSTEIVVSEILLLNRQKLATQKE